MVNIDEFICNKLKEIATQLPELVKERPSSFTCGLKMGYKQCLLDLDNIIKDE